LSNLFYLVHRSSTDRLEEHKMKQSEKNAAQVDSLATLRKLLMPGDTVTTIVRSVASSGMSRRITLLVARDNEVRDITWDVARAFGESVKQRGQYVQDAGLWVAGCGMDMCFATVYNLGRMLFPEGFGELAWRTSDPTATIPAGRPQTPVEAAAMVADGFVFRGRNGDSSGWDTDGGYALRKVSL
jgi:hypothetical protein